MPFSGVALLCEALFQGLWRSLGGSLTGAICAPLHMLVVLLCSAYKACSGSFLFKAPHPIPFLYYYVLYIVLIIVYSLCFPLFFQYNVTGAGAGPGAGFLWQAGLVAGLQVVPVPHVPGHPTSICDEGIK